MTYQRFCTKTGLGHKNSFTQDFAFSAQVCAEWRNGTYLKYVSTAVKLQTEAMEAKDK